MVSEAMRVSAFSVRKITVNMSKRAANLGWKKNCIPRCRNLGERPRLRQCRSFGIVWYRISGRSPGLRHR